MIVECAGCSYCERPKARNMIHAMNLLADKGWKSIGGKPTCKECQ